MTRPLRLWWRWQLVFGILLLVAGAAQVTIDAIELAGDSPSRRTWLQLVIGVVFILIGVGSIVAAISFRRRVRLQESHHEEQS